MPTSYENWQMVAIPRSLWNKIKEEVDEKRFWSSPSEYVRDAIKQKLNIYMFRFSGYDQANNHKAKRKDLQAYT